MGNHYEDMGDSNWNKQYGKLRDGSELLSKS